MEDLKKGIASVQSPEFDQQVSVWMTDWNVPGCAVAVIQDGKIILSKGYGYRDVGNKLPVDKDTVFAIGSTTKAFTAASIALLVDQGRINWDMPVRHYMPFDLWDQEAAQRMTAVDLLSHRSGLPRHDAVWYGSSLTRQELIHSLKYLPPSADFRSIFQYQNLMFTAAGYLVECVTGESWEGFMQRSILDPLGMSDTSFSIKQLSEQTNVAKPYIFSDGMTREIPFRNIDAISPAGGINSNLKDLLHWLEIHLAGGCFKGQRIISEANIRMTHTPVTPISSSFGRLLQSFDEIGDESYALGWFCHTYRGRNLMRHGGHIDGFSTQISFMPSINAGVIMLTNVGGSSFMFLPTFLVYDFLLGEPVIDWNLRIKDEEQNSKQALERATAWFAQRKILRKAPSHPPQQYTGEYQHPAYGLITINCEGEELIATYKGQQVELRHYHYDVFDWISPRSKSFPLKAHFQNDVFGQVTSLHVPLEPSVEPLVFKRLPAPELREVSYFEQFAGLYDWSGKEAAITRLQNGLSLAIPQFDHLILSPGLVRNLFDVVGRPNWVVEFSTGSDGDEIPSVSLVTPMGKYYGRKMPS